MGAKQSELPIAIYYGNVSTRLPKELEPNISGTVSIGTFLWDRDEPKMQSLVNRQVCEEIKILNIQYKLEFCMGMVMKAT